MNPDQSTDYRLSLVYPDVKTRWLRLRDTFFQLHHRQLRVSQGLRTYSDQLVIWSKGRAQSEDGSWIVVDASQIVTHAMPGDSWHHFSAVDSCFWGSDPFLAQDPDSERMWSEHARLAEAFGFESGYRWIKQDRPHLQMRYGLMLKQVKDTYDLSGLVGVWKQFDAIIGVS